jgi:hypothetical protein
LPEPRCFGSIVRLTQEGPDERNRILFSNPDVFDPMEEHATVRLSYDECESWPVKRRPGHLCNLIGFRCAPGATPLSFPSESEVGIALNL